MTLVLACELVSAQVKPIAKSPSNNNQNQPKSTQLATPAAAPAPAPRVPTGPTGFGSLKIGMSKEALEKLTENDGVYLQSPMTSYIYKNSTPIEGVDKFDAKIITPLSLQSVSTVLTFQNDELTSFYMNFEGVPTGYEKSLRQITEKYGPGKETNDRKEEQCIYKNGANFKITTGAISSTWIEEVSSSERIQTRLSDWVFSLCPSNLRYGGVSETGIKSMSMQRLKPTAETEKKNLF